MQSCRTIILENFSVKTLPTLSYLDMSTLTVQINLSSRSKMTGRKTRTLATHKTVILCDAILRVGYRIPWTRDLLQSVWLGRRIFPSRHNFVALYSYLRIISCAIIAFTRVM